MKGTSEDSTLDYYRCDLCGEVWMLDQDDIANPPKLQRKSTGLNCLECREPVAVEASRTRTAMVFWCPACGHRWAAYEPGSEAH